MTHIVIENDRRPALRQALPGVLQRRQDRAVNGLREAVRDELANGRLLANDTGTTAESLYIKSPLGSDYQARREAAEQAYTSGVSRWAEPVREALGVDAYTPEHFAERAGPEEDLPAGEIITALATFFAVGFWWQMGHQNEFTGRYEQRSWFLGPVTRWAQNELAGYFAALELDLEQAMSGVGMSSIEMSGVGP